MTPFEELLKELGNYLGITLQADSNQSCRLAFFDSTLFVQIDLTSGADQILVGCELGELQPGPYREKILTQALIVNGVNDLQGGALAYSEKKSQLVLFQFLSLIDLTGEKLYHFLQLFTEQALQWVEAIKRGEVLSLEESSVSTTLESPFGLKR